jgi:VWFA-related protein
VVVTQKSGTPVAGLQQQDFTLLDNKAPQTITSFQAVGEREADQSVILVMDAVNTDYDRLSYLRTEIGKFLRADGGHLAYPTALATFSDKGIQIEENFSTDGTALSASLDRANAGLRSSGLSRSTGFHGEAGRIQLSMQALDQLVASAAQVPGRKIVIWVSPGWPSMAEVQQGPTQQQQVFGTVVSISTELLQAHVTLYSVDPPGGDALTRDSFYKQFLKGVSKPNQAYAGNLALQVFAIQSGGLAYPARNDMKFPLMLPGPSGQTSTTAWKSKWQNLASSRARARAITRNLDPVTSPTPVDARQSEKARGIVDLTASAA